MVGALLEHPCGVRLLLQRTPTAAIACGEHPLFAWLSQLMLNCCAGSNTSPRSESITALCTGASWVGSDRYRPRRVRCRGCGATQVLLPAALQPRRADCTEVIGTALARKAKGLGYRRIAAALGRSPSTVRRWLRRARDPGHLNRLWQRGAQELIRLDAEAFNALASTGNLLRDTLTVLAAAAWWARRRLGIVEPVWTLIGLYTRGRLLAPPG